MFFVAVMLFGFVANAQSESDLKDGNVSVPSYEEGDPREMLGTFGYRYYKIYIDFEGGSSGDGDLYKDKDGGEYYISDGVNDIYYKSKSDAIRALYIYKKYSVITRAGKK